MAQEGKHHDTMAQEGKRHWCFTEQRLLARFPLKRRCASVKIKRTAREVEWVGFCMGETQALRHSPGKQARYRAAHHCAASRPLCRGNFHLGGAGTIKRSGVKKHDQMFMFIELNSLDLDVSTSSEVEAGETADHA
jgi:hypothetical protein